MNHTELLRQREAFSGTDAEFLAWARQVSVTYTPETWIRYTTIANVFGEAVAEQVYQILLPTPGRAAAFVNPGFDVSSQVTRDAMQAIADSTPAAAPVVSWCLSQGRIETMRCVDWGCEDVTQELLDEARRRDAAEAWDVAETIRIEARRAQRNAYVAGAAEELPE